MYAGLLAKEAGNLQTGVKLRGREVHQDLGSKTARERGEGDPGSP
jgi:hypothetical protein